VAQPKVAENTAFAAAPTVGSGTVPAAALWWDGFSIAANASEEDAAASFRAMVHAIQLPTAEANPDAAAWLVPGFQPGPASACVIATAQAGARPYPLDPQMGVMHRALGAELADFMQGRESAEQALADVAATYEAGAREQGFLQ
jgi:maltose-binding protein MalE